MPSSGSEALAHRRRRGGMLLVALFVSSCAQVSSSVSYDLRPTGLPPVKRTTTGVWEPAAVASARRVSEGAMIHLDIRRRRRCEISEVTTYEQRRYVRRQNETPRQTALALGLGVVATAIVGWTLVRYADGTALSHKNGSDDDKLTGTGTAMLYATPFTLGLLGGIYDLASATDSSDDLGRVERTQTHSEPCGDEPAAQATLALRAADRVIAQGRTDERGAVEVLLPVALLGDESWTATLDEAPLSVVPAPAALLATVRGGSPAEGSGSGARATGASLRAPAAPGASSLAGASSSVVRAGAAPSVAGDSGLVPEVTPEGLSLLGIALRRSSRSALRAALEEKGATLDGTVAAGPFSDRFDVEKLAPPCLGKLDLLFDRDDVFVGLKLSGPPRCPEEPRLRELFQGRYGTPRPDGSKPRPLWVWRSEGFDISFGSTRADKGPSLVVRDSAALKAETGRK